MSKKAENFKIRISDGFPVEKALRRFKRMCDSYGVIRKYKDKEAYQKPSIKEKEKKEAAEKRRRKTVGKMQRYRQKL